MTIFPKSKAGEERHRRHKRQIEAKIMLRFLSDVFNVDEAFKKRSPEILEFGCGDGFHVPYFQNLGNVTASDTYRSDKLLGNVRFVQTKISDSPFKSREFDIIFSNHVIEHIENLESSFAELKRIGKSSCIYAFSVPTNVWLVLSIPAYYYNLIRFVFMKISGRISNRNIHANNKSHNYEKETTKWYKTIFYIFPLGHGVIKNWIKCFNSFSIKSWKQLFSDNDFRVLYTKPLLLYGPSEWPLIPTMNPFEKFSIASSVLFIMKK